MTILFPEKRTEHNIKNRFFSILGKILGLQTKKVKKIVRYRNKNLLKKILNCLTNKIKQGI